MIRYYARKKQHGFAYKEYPDLEGEKWERIEGSKTNRGDHWEISNKSRVKRVTKYASNVLWGNQLSCSNEYPTITINEKHWMCHILAFKTFHKKLWDDKKPGEMVLHKDDDKDDFRPHKLYLGMHADNMKDAHDNGKSDGTKSARKKCASYIDGIHEKDHLSQSDVAKYLKNKGCSKASIRSIIGSIGIALSGKWKTAYGRTWQII